MWIDATVPTVADSHQTHVAIFRLSGQRRLSASVANESAVGHRCGPVAQSILGRSRKATRRSSAISS